MGKYHPLAQFLYPLPQREVTLSFAQVEETLGSALPATARRDRPWWANTLASNHASQWLIAGWKVSRVDLGGEEVTFVRDAEIRRAIEQNPDKDTIRKLFPTRSRGQYQLLREFFTAMPADQVQVALSFEEIGKVMSQPLPKTAFHDEPWWANTKASPQGSAWTAAGWCVSRVYMKAQVAVFRRRHEDPLRVIPRLVGDLLDGKPHVGRPGAARVAAWIGFCRRIGWYFEGTVLYERVGIQGDTLSETEQARVEEDYSTCKRELQRYVNRNRSEAPPAPREEKLNAQE